MLLRTLDAVGPRLRFLNSIAFEPRRADASRARRNVVGRNRHGRQTYRTGEKLERGQSLTSNNGAYTLTLQDDGNLVLAARGQAVWATGTNGQDVVRPEVQTDGNFVLYTSDKPVWHTDTKGAKDVRLVLQDDRNVVSVRRRRACLGRRRRTPTSHLRRAPEAERRPQSLRPPPRSRCTRCRAARPTTTATATAARSADLHGGLRRHPVGDLGALLR